MDNSEDKGAAAPPLANPAPLGLAAFALTTFCLSMFNSGVIGDSALEAEVLPLALFYGGLAQFAAGLLEFKRGNTFGLTAFTSYGAFWMAFAGYVKFVVPGLDPAHTHVATGLFLIAWFIFTLYMTVAATTLDKATLAVFAALTLTFLFLALGAFCESTALTRIGGWLGLLTAFLAWYASFAGVVNETRGRKIIPVG
ncbi:acetate uptake transporter [Streptomyces sp. NPDC050738]|uniref:acetate uptake transporter n=1 Tax=Streptomyces sp. NPDC050738 TaxID=3154744 RepID=UPI0034219947